MGKNDFFGVPKYFGKSSSYQIWEELVCVLTDMLSLEKNKWFKKKNWHGVPLYLILFIF